MAQQTVLGGRYEVTSLLGRGGMASVYLATDRVLGRQVAVKVLSKQFAADASFVERFRREAQAAASLSHPNVVGVYDTGSDGNVHYIVMEYVQGRTLADIIRAEGPLLPERAAEIAGGVAAALAFSHRAGIVHRDVKPANIMITRSGDIKVMDFGIARAQAGDSLTRTQTVLGTATYFSPEQAQGESVDARSDIYALGCVLYEMMTGNPPFTGDTAVGVAYKHVREEPVPPSRVNHDVPPSLDAIDLKCLAKNPANRYQTAGELREDLDRFRRGEPVSATPVLPAEAPTQVVARPTSGTQVMKGIGSAADQDRRRRIIIISVVAAAILLVGGYYLVRAATPSQPMVTVPNVQNIDANAACLELQQKNLKCDDSTKVASTTVQKGYVISFQPTGQVAEGTTIRLTVSAGKPTAFVPNVFCEPRATAQSDLRQAGFVPVRAGTATSPNCTTPGYVAKQDPASPHGQTKRPEGSNVFLYFVPQASPTTPPPTTPPPTSPPTSPPPTSPSPSPT